MSSAPWFINSSPRKVRRHDFGTGWIFSWAGCPKASVLPGFPTIWHIGMEWPGYLPSRHGSGIAFASSHNTWGSHVNITCSVEPKLIILLTRQTFEAYIKSRWHCQSPLVDCVYDYSSQRNLFQAWSQISQCSVRAYILQATRSILNVTEVLIVLLDHLLLPWNHHVS